MPIYEYECTRCRKHHEIMQKITDRPLAKCPECHGTLRKMISNTSFVLKGSGWYITDYARNDKKAEKPKDAVTEASEKTADSARGDNKADTRSETTQKKDEPKKAAVAE